MKRYLLAITTCLITACSHPIQPSVADDTANDPNLSVKAYQKGGNIIEERRIKGFLYSLKVTPNTGKPYYLINANGDTNTLNNHRPTTKIPAWQLLSW